MTKDHLIKISIFHTNDMHGELEAMARLSSFARELREGAIDDGRTVFFWDIGDAADRKVSICSATKGAAFAPILNSMGYSLMAMGNAISLTYGPQAMTKLAKRASFPILAANCRDGDGPLVEGLQEYAIIALPNRLSMGAIGLTATSDFYSLFGMNFPDVHILTQGLVDKLKSRGVSLVVVLSHLGLGEDRLLAEAVDGVDLILGAHTHDALPVGEERGGVLIGQAGEYAQAIGRFDIDLDPGTGRIISRSATIYDVPRDADPDPGVLSAIQAAEHEVEEILALEIGEIAATLNIDHFRECGIGNLAADALRERMKADIAIVSSGLFHRPVLKGKLTTGQLNKACFTTANPWLSKLSGAQIVDALERGFDPTTTHCEPKSYRGTPIGIPQISGMEIVVDPNAQRGKRIITATIKEVPISPDRKYLLAHTDAETLADVGYLDIEDEQTVEIEVPTILPEVIAEYVTKNSPVAQPTMGRIRLV